MVKSAARFLGKTWTFRARSSARESGGCRLTRGRFIEKLFLEKWDAWEQQIAGITARIALLAINSRPAKEQRIQKNRADGIVTGRTAILTLAAAC